MKYIKIRAKNYNEAMMKLKMDYGDDAIPISHKYIKEGGFFSSKLLAREVVELTAAIQEMKKVAKLKPKVNSTLDFTVDDAFSTKKKIRSDALNRINDDAINSKIKNHEKGRVVNNIENNKIPEPGSMPKEKNCDNSGTIGDINRDETNSLKKLEREFCEIKEKLNKLLDGRVTEDEQPAVNMSEEDKSIKPYLEILKNNDFDDEECIALIDGVKNSISREDLKDKFKIEKTLKELLKSKIITSGPIKTGTKKKVVMFFGPTGVGKTTSMAKLGALYALREGHKVAFITIDNYRIAATEQLKKYSEIMKIPIYVVNDQKSFKEKIDKEKSEIIMVDTSGRSHRNELKISEIKSFADMVEYDFEKILCVSANTKKGDLSDVFKAFDKINFDSIIITKVDETNHIGNVIDIADKYKKPISYYTDGQEVPNDINVAEPDKIVSMIFEGTGK